MVENQNIWIQELKKGNELAALNLYNSYAKAMYNTLIRITGQNEVAQDLLQEAFVKAFDRINDLKEPQAFSGWLQRIVINAGLEYVRKSKIYFEDIASLSQIPNDEVNEKLVDDKMLQKAIKELPDGCRTVLSLYAIEGMKHKEIAEHLNIAESTSKTQYRHAKHLLKEKLIQYYEN